MKKFLLVALPALVLFSCKQKDSNQFEVKGVIKNAASTNIFLQEISVTGNTSLIIDSAKTDANGKFSLHTIARGENLYRLLLQNDTCEFYIINDNPEVEIEGDAIDFHNPKFKNSDQTQNLYRFFAQYGQTLEVIKTKGQALDSIAALQPANDSITAVYRNDFTASGNELKKLVESYIASAKSPVVATYGFTYALPELYGPQEMLALITNVAKKFPGYEPLQTKQKQLAAYIADSKKEKPAATSPLIGKDAPEIMLKDTEGKTFNLGSLKGKYVLVDFWASWCPPCRAENPNVLAAYNQFKDKNFTILGVSLDDDVTKWKKAIAEDKLAWKQVSELKGWKSKAVEEYGFNGIPFNVLVNPEGKIIAADLREGALQAKLAEVVK